MQECPRCGFLQPHDRFCAYCGLDIENFEAKSPPWYHNALLNAKVQVGVIALSLVGAFGYIYWQQQSLHPPAFPGYESLSQTPSEGEGPQSQRTAKPISSSDKKSQTVQRLPSSDEKPDSNSNKKLAAHSESDSDLRENPGETVAESGEPKSVRDEEDLSLKSQQTALLAQSHQQTQGAAASDQMFKEPTQMQLAFAEIPRDLLGEIYSHSQILQESSTHQVLGYSGTRPFEELLNKNSKSRRLPGNVNQALTRGPLKFSSPADPQAAGVGEFEGLSFFAEVGTVNPMGVVLEIDGGLSLRDASSDQIVRINLSASYTVALGTTLLFLGILPHRPLNQKELALFQQTPLIIMNSPEFMAGETEFGIFLQLK